MFELKEGVKLEDMMVLDHRVLIVLGHFMSYAEKYDLPVVITSLITDREGVKATSRTHEEGRAIDIRSYTWSDKHKEGVIKYLNHICSHYGAVSASDYERRVIIHHESYGGGEHFHLQVSKISRK